MGSEAFNKIILKKNSKLAIQFVRYTFVGGIAFFIDFSLLYLLTNHLNIHYLISAVIAFIVGLGVNYMLSIFWVFDKRVLSNRMAEFSIFAFIGVVGLGLNEGFMWLFTGILGIFYLYSKLLSTIFVYLWNFSARKFILFR